MNYYVSKGVRRYVVKLNNPLMGTETITAIFFWIYSLEIPVKLNNPLMGTETMEELAINGQQQSSELN